MTAVSKTYLTAAALLVATLAQAGCVEQWRKFYDASSGEDIVTDMAVTSDAIAYVCGSSFFNLNTDFILHKYDEAGTKVWTKRYDRSARDDEGIAVKVDPNGDILVAGNTKDTSFNQDITLVKYSSAGTQLWARHWDGGADDICRGMVLDATGNAYVLAESDNGVSYDLVIIQWLANGTQGWVRTYDGPSHLNEQPRAITIDIPGNALYACGATRNLGSQEDMLIVKYTLAGAFQWAKSFDGAAGGSDIAIAVAVDSTGRPVIAGPSSGPGTDSDMWTILLSSSGVKQWDMRKDGGVGGGDNVTSMVINSSDDIYVAGRLYTGTKNDMGLVKYDSAGVEQWWRAYTTSGGNDDEEAGDVTLDEFENVLITGASLGMTTVKYAPNGNFICVVQPAHSIFDRGIAVRTLPYGRVFVAGNWYIDVGDIDTALFLYYHTSVVNGQLDLDGLHGPYPSSITFDLRKPATTDVLFTPTATVNGTGGFSVELRQGKYDLSIKHENWLRRTQALDVPGVATSTTLSLLNGDAVPDNIVNLIDLNLMLTEFGRSPGAGFADIDKSGTVALEDLSIALLNFGLPGDN